jgi:hypothetical protein
MAALLSMFFEPPHWFLTGTRDAHFAERASGIVIKMKISICLFSIDHMEKTSGCQFLFDL